MSQAKILSELFKIQTRFCRSVNIAADVNDPEALSGYVVTPLTRAVLRRVSEGLRPGSRARAWSITGPYGAGKSACALFLAKVLGYPQSTDARHMLRGVDAELYIELCEQIPGLAEGGFFVTLMVGSREPLAPAIIRGLARSLSSAELSSPEANDFVGWLHSQYEANQSGCPISVATFIDAVEQASRLVKKSRPEILGLLIVVDELGKLLEHATMDPAHEDVFYLQALAELAARSGDYPIGILTILHQAFEHYAARLGFIQQQEWAKVQGRFEDIAFYESPGELLKLIGNAIEPVPPQDGLATIVGKEVVLAAELGLAPPELSSREITEILRRCAPLHPTVSLVLGRLFRSRLAQNERSLFAFLASGEVHGLQDYLRRESWTGSGSRPFYRLDELYDYVVAVLGSSLYAHSQGKRWAEIADSLSRLPTDFGPLEVRLVKAIGLLGILGDQRRLKASMAILAYAFADGDSTSANDVEKAIDRLVENKIAVHRRHKDAYGLWEGSDIDLDEQFQKGMASIDKSTSLAALLQSHGYLRPYVAKRHLHETGTLRYFVPLVIDEAQLDEVVSESFEPADGAVVFVLGDGNAGSEVVLKKVVSTSEQLPSDYRNLFLFAVPRDTTGLREALEEVRAWEWVERNTKELHSDSVAREELKALQLDAQGRVNELCSRYFDKASSYRSSRWVWAGKEVNFNTPVELSAAVSAACDKAYAGSPQIHNELINRRTLSSAAAAARRTLVERMLGEPDAPRLGIVRFPPELSMYRSVLERTGLHHQAGDGWEFGPAPGEDPCRVRPLWQGIDDFLKTTERGKRSVSDLFEVIRRPPYGIRDGLLPIFLAAAVIYWQEDLALYENGSFIPKIDIAAFERLMKAPNQFALQRYDVGEARSYLFEQYSALFKTQQSLPVGSTLVSAIRPIITFVKQLPPYTNYTRTLSQEAMAARESISRAREPHRLLFTDLPTALGMDPEEVSRERRAAEAFACRLSEVLGELAKAYDILLDRAQSQLWDALRLPLDATNARKEIAGRAVVLRDRVSDLRLKAFVMRLGEEQLPYQEWLEAVLSCVTAKSPRQWNDQDVLRYGMALAEVAGQFLRVEEILTADGLSSGASQGTRVVRVAFTSPTGDDHSAMVQIAPEEERVIDDVVANLESALSRLTASRKIRDAAIAELVRRALSQSSK